MFDSRIIVFKEIKVLDQVLYQWFRLGEEGEPSIVPDVVYSEEEHWELVKGD